MTAADDVKVCAQCNETFVRASKQSRSKFATRKFCSVECGHENQRVEITEHKPCGYCGEVFWRRRRVARSTFAKVKFCSRVCSRKGQRRTGKSNVQRTTCMHGGHPWIPENIWVDNRGHGKCKRCQQKRDKGRKRPARKRTRRSAPKPRPVLQSVPPPPETPQRPVWRPAGFAPVPNTRRSA
jgi:hypothetical protein